MSDTPQDPNRSTVPDEVPTQGPVEPDTAPAKKPGLFSRLFGRAATGAELEIAIAPFVDIAGVDHARSLSAVFADLDGVRTKHLREKPILTPESPRAEHLPAACGQAMHWVSKFNADLVLWGDVPPPGTTLYIHFAAPPPVDEDPAGTISPFQALTLPVGFDPEDLGALLLAAALAAMNPKSDAKRQSRRSLVAEALEHAAEAIERIPSDFTTREQASIQAMFANSLASFGHLFPGTEVYHRASLAYTKAIKGTLRSESPTNWAYLQRNLGTVLQALGERTDDVDTLDQAAAAYRAALEVFSLEATPFPWATTQNRLGEVLYRLDSKSGDTKGLKEALVIYQGALKVLTKRSMPLLWSETMNNLGQAAQMLGRELNNEDVLERAVTAYKQALLIRKRDTQPTLWAATQNNMGSALFILGRMTNADKYFEEALNAFMGAREVYTSLGLTRMVEITEKNIAHAEERLPDGAGKGAQKDASMWWLEEEDPAQKS
ncbi:tetratricopeptide repeat protein [Magnetovibrio sp.]|uniref:tetratricopeptide repeat protein n=1 Tax=Magnetovibrio sp. TaxID=2024836 RepID=UPI002F9359DE